MEIKKRINKKLTILSSKKIKELEEWFLDFNSKYRVRFEDSSLSNQIAWKFEKILFVFNFIDFEVVAEISRKFSFDRKDEIIESRIDLILFIKAIIEDEEKLEKKVKKSSNLVGGYQDKE